MSDDDQDDSSKTEDPTPKKLEEARKKGQVALSREVNNWIMLLAGTLVVLAIGPGMMSDLAVLMRTYIERADDMPEMPGGMQFAVVEALREVLKIIALPLLFLLAAAFVGPFAQVGPLFSPDILKMDISIPAVSSAIISTRATEPINSPVTNSMPSSMSSVPKAGIGVGTIRIRTGVSASEMPSTI